MAQFEIQDLSFTYPTGKKSLEHINITIEEGDYVAVCGKSGSGKTTLLKHLKSVLTPHGISEGQVLYLGKPLAEVNLRTQSSEIGYVMQNPDNQLVTDKVWHELAFGLESLGRDQKEMRLAVAEMASYFGIQNWFHKNVNQLSGGQKQLLNLASIMAMQPKVLILDEPTSQLDPIAASDFLNTVRKINLELGTTVIITEHRLEEVFPSADQVLVLKNGQVLTMDEPQKVGGLLYHLNDDMMAALPTAMQIYYGTGNEGISPLTVREGRRFLTKYVNKSDQIVMNDELKHTKANTFNKQIIRIGDKAEALRDEDDSPYVEPDQGYLRAKELWFRYEKKGADILQGVNLNIEQGKFYGIVGGNGTGKSTLLKALAGVVKPYRGKVKCEGRISLLPQDPTSLFVKKSVVEELEEMSPNDLEQIEAMMKQCDIVELRNAHPYDLSGGEQQRVALAKVLLTHPDVLLLDEPTKGIDCHFKQTFARIIRALIEQGITVIMVSHDVEFCAKYTDVVSMFFDGGIVTTNKPRPFFSKNSFYTTAANRMSRHVFNQTITNEEVISACQQLPMS